MFFLRMVAGWIRKMAKAFKDLCIFISNYLKIISAIYNSLGFYASEKMSSNIFYYQVLCFRFHQFSTFEIYDLL